MRIVDAHAHLLDEPGYLDGLLSSMDRCDVERVCLSGIGPLFGCAGNDEVEDAVRVHPDRVIGSYFARPGVDGAACVDSAAARGFRMLKVSIPRVPYDDPSLFPLWDAACRHGMPVLFHTGILTTKADARGERVSSWFTHPVRVEAVCHEFPDLRAIVAHLGVSWNMDAAELARIQPNVYVDLTGEPDGWRLRADRGGMDRYLWWPGAFRKAVFGTDVHFSKIAAVLEQDRARFDSLGVDPVERRRFFGETMAGLLGLAPAPSADAQEAEGGPPT